MKILYDLTYAQGGSFFSGLYEYGKSIFKEIIKEHDVTLLLLKNEKMDEWIVSSAKNVMYLESKKWSKGYFKEITKISEGFDILYFPTQLNRGKIKTNAKLIFTIHDLIENDLAKVGKINKYEGLFLDGLKGKIKSLIKKGLRVTGYRHYTINKNLKYNIKHAYKLLSVSEYTKKEIVKRYNVNENIIYTCYTPFKVGVEEKEYECPYKNYNLMVSASRYTKNAYRLILALDELYDEGYERKTVITGRLSEGIKNKIRHIDKYVLLDYVKDYELEALYKNAELFIFPSLAEGFGMPPLEAMKYGTKVITSTSMSLYELYNETIQFDPYNINEIKEAIKKSDSLTEEKMLEIFNKITKKQDEDLVKAVKVIADEI